MSKPYTGFNFVYILTTVAATMEAFEPDVVVFAYIRYFRNDAAINVPVFRLWGGTEGTFADPLLGPF